MKPKHLKSPFVWKERKVLIQDRVWYVPQHLDCYESFTFPGWHSEELFGNHNPVHVEYCSGNGSWIAEKALNFPEINWLAVEMRFDRVKQIWSKLKNYQLNNLIVVCGAAEIVTKYYISDNSIQKTFVNFPDPWPKRRHAKHRIIQSPFISELLRILVLKGEATFVTDDPDYSKEMQEVLFSAPEFSPLHPKPYYVTNIEGYGSSFFEELWREKGKEIHYHQFFKNDPDPRFPERYLKSN